MIFHPTLKAICRYLDKVEATAKAKKIGDHLERCHRCRQRLQTLKNMEPALTSKSQLSATFKGKVVSSLKDIRRIKTSTCAEIKKTIGHVMVYRNGDNNGVEAFPGMALLKGDTLRGLGNSLALVELNDGSSLYLNKETEIQFPSANYPLSLLAGEFFAMMKRQQKPFDIKTPSAVLGVIGTDFDTKVAEKKKTILTVFKGKVSFQNESGKAIVKKKHRVEAFINTPPRPMKIREARSISMWTGPIGPEKRKGKTILKNLGLLVLLLAIIGAGIWNFARSKPISLINPYVHEGMSMRIRNFSERTKGPNWLECALLVTRTEVLEADRQNGSRVLITVEDVKLPEGHEAYAATKQFVGRQAEYQISPKGQSHSIRIHDGKPLVLGTDIGMFIGALTSSDFSFLFRKNTVAPGEEWSAEFEEEIPGYPNSYLRVQGTTKFVGFEKRDGVRVAVFRDNYSGSLGGGMLVEKISEPPATKEIYLDHIEFEGFSESLIDVRSGRVLSLEGYGMEKNLQCTVKTLIPGKPPTQEPYHELWVHDVRSFSTIEYLTPLNEMPLEKNVTRGDVLQSPVFQVYKQEQEKTNFQEQPYAGLIAALKESPSLEDALVVGARSIGKMPRFFIKRAFNLQEWDPQSIITDLSTRKPVKVDMKEPIKEHSLAFVYYKSDSSSDLKRDIFLYEDGVWKLYLPVPDHGNAEDDLMRVGVFVKNHRLVDDSILVNRTKSKHFKTYFIYPEEHTFPQQFDTLNRDRAYDLAVKMGMAEKDTWPSTPEAVIRAFWEAAGQWDTERMFMLCPGSVALDIGKDPWIFSSVIHIRPPEKHPYRKGVTVYPVEVQFGGGPPRTAKMALAKTDDGRLVIDGEKTVWP